MKGHACVSYPPAIPLAQSIPPINGPTKRAAEDVVCANPFARGIRCGAVVAFIKILTEVNAHTLANRRAEAKRIIAVMTKMSVEGCRKARRKANSTYTGR